MKSFFVLLSIKINLNDEKSLHNLLLINNKKKNIVITHYVYCIVYLRRASNKNFIIFFN